jgi:hypothetical protein
MFSVDTKAHHKRQGFHRPAHRQRASSARVSGAALHFMAVREMVFSTADIHQGRF